MREVFKDGSSATLTADDYWATLTFFDKDGVKINSFLSESILPLIDHIERYRKERESDE